MTSTILEEGIFFNMGDAYYADPIALGSTDIKQLKNGDGFGYWYNSPMNPIYEKPEDSDALIYGNFFHTTILEPHLVDSRYMFPLANEPKNLLTAKDIANALAALGISYKKAETKARLIELYGRDIEAAGFVIDELYKERAKKDGKISISNSQYDLLQKMIGSAKYWPGLHEFHLKDSLREVSIILTDSISGAKLRCRLDAVNDNGFSDAKSIASLQEHKIKNAFFDLDYPIQGSGYLYAILQAYERRDTLQTDDPVKLKRFWELVERQLNDPKFHFWFWGKDAPYAQATYTLDGNTLDYGLTCWQTAMKNYRSFMQSHGSAPWPSIWPDQPRCMSQLGG